MSRSFGSHFAVRSKRVVRSSGVDAAVVEIANEKIVGVFPYETKVTCQLFDFENQVIMPGIVDTHAHINEPGRTDWEGFETATKAAAAGGITTVIDMPLNSIPATTTLSALHEKAAVAQGKCSVDYGFWGGVVPGNAAELETMVRAGAHGFKCFLIESGVDEFQHVQEDDLKKALPILKKLGVPLLAHAELDLPAIAKPLRHSSKDYLDYLFSRPKGWENEAVRMLARLAFETKAQIHIVHLSSSEATEIVKKAKQDGLSFTAETCPHYLTLCAEEIPSGATHFKCAPPIRERANQDALWEALRDNILDFIVSDHSPCTPQLKKLDTGDFTSAWGGISSLQFGLSLIWTEARRRGFTLNDLARWMCERTAAFAGLEKRKGKIEVGLDADIVVWDPEAQFQISTNQIFHRHAVSPYVNKDVYGKVMLTLLRGQPIYDQGTFHLHLGKQV